MFLKVSKKKSDDKKKEKKKENDYRIVGDKKVK